MADKYTKVLEVVTEVKDDAYAKFIYDFTKEREWIDKLDKKQAQNIKTNYADYQKKLKQIEALKQAISDISMFGDKDAKKNIKSLKAELKALEAPEKWKQFKSDLEDTLTKKFLDAGKKVADFFKQSFKDAIAELKVMSSYNYSTSLFQSSESRETAMTYGLDSANAYGLDKAMDFMGVSSLEDTALFNPNQQELFAQLIGRYVDKYNSLNDSGFFEDWDRFTVDFKLFKEEIMYDMMDFLMENKEELKAGFTMGMELMKDILFVIGKIAQLIGGERTQYSKDIATTDIINSYKTTSNSTSLTVNNTFNGVQTSNRTQLLNAGELTYAQIKKVLYSE